MIVVSYGGGTNSTAMLVGMKARGIVPDVIIFADTGGEKPHTYSHLEYMKKWCADHGFPDITVVANRPNGETLEDECIRRRALPSLAYGFKTCSQKFKIRPQRNYLKKLRQTKSTWESGNKVIVAVGFDADEPNRAVEYDDPRYKNWYPLVEWEWGREECIDAIASAGIPQPGKSSCFFCPSSKQSEVRWLASAHPDLMERAAVMEQNAELTQVSGLGRSYRWSDLIATDDLFPECFIDQACGCYDG